jgi:RimJ/RimL family protein N-acetyltransferase
VSVRDGEAIGFVEATIEDPELFYVAYVLNPAWWRLGYGREATVALIDLIFDRFEVTRCVVEMDTPNLASIALAESLGFRRIDTVIDPADGAEEHVYEITRAEWSRRRSAPANH